LFAALLPEETTGPFIEREFARVPEPKLNGKALSRPDFQKLLAKIRRVGLSHVRGDLVVGVDAVAAPVFNAGGTMVMALALVTPRNTLDLSVDGSACNALLEESASVSMQLATQGLDSQ
jgi:DNA-binding IclR family transcriptional regulator